MEEYAWEIGMSLPVAGVSSGGPTSESPRDDPSL